MTEGMIFMWLSGFLFGLVVRDMYQHLWIQRRRHP